MKNKILLAVFLSLLLFAMGCDSNGGEDSTAPSSQFIGGSLGLVMEFVEGTPPPEIADMNQPFGISIKLENKGDHDMDVASDATVSITGIDPADFGLTTAALIQDSPEPLMGARKDPTGQPISGTIVTMDFPATGEFQHQSEIAGAVTYNIKADVCYKYGSVANTKMCVLQDILGTSGQQSNLCSINEEKPIDESGAPVHVTSFRESVASATKVAFVFKVGQVDNQGHVYGLGSKCDETFSNREKVHVKVDTGMNDGLTCTGLSNGVASGSIYEGDATLLNGEREIRCTQTVSNPTDLEKLVRIDLSYDYKQSVTKQLVVKHLG